MVALAAAVLALHLSPNAEEPGGAQFIPALGAHEAILVVGFSLECHVFSAQWLVALLAVGACLGGTALALTLAVLGDELGAELLVTRDAREALLVPRLTHRGENGILDLPVALRAVLPFHAFGVEAFALLDEVLPRDAPAAFRARHELSRAVRAVRLVVVIEVRSHQLVVAFGAREMLLVI